MLQNIKSKLQHREAGFTIIEVALVLAIAGLIFLVVFLALPALQKSQRDTGRRQDVGRIVSALQSQAADNQGDVTVVAGATDGSVTTGIQGYIGKLSQIQSVSPAPSASTDTTKANITVGSSSCSGSNPSGTPGGTKDAAVTIKLESGGVYCQAM